MNRMKKNIKLRKVEIPEEENLNPVLISDETIKARINKIIDRMKLNNMDAIVIYADVEHGANFEYLTGFIPRFEEALLVLHITGDAYLLLGNEVLSMAKHSRIAAKAIHVSYFSLPDQPLNQTHDIMNGFKEAMIKENMNIGLVGWKGFYNQSQGLYDIPHYIVDALSKKNVNLCNATGLFISPLNGARTINSINEIEHYEYGQCLASNGIRRVLNDIEIGKREIELATLLESQGQRNNVVTICSSGERFYKANLYPSSKKIAMGERISITVGYKGGLASRAAYIANTAEDLPHEIKNYEEDLAKPYFYAICTWLEKIHVGIEGKEVYNLVEEVLPKENYHWSLNPGHLSSDEEWLSSPIYKDSDIKIKSGMIFQIDIIPSITGYAGCSCENGILLADHKLQEEIKQQAPQMWERFMKRRNYIEHILHIPLHGDVMPLSNLVAFYRPFLLNKDVAYTVE